MRAAALSQLSWAQSVQNLPVSLGGSDPTLLGALTLHLPGRGRQGRVTQEWPGKKVLTPPGAPLDMLVTLRARPSRPTPQEPVWEGMWKAYRGEGRARRPRRPGPQGAGRGARSALVTTGTSPPRFPASCPCSGVSEGRPVTPPSCLGVQDPSAPAAPSQCRAGRCCHRGGGGSGSGQAPPPLAGAPHCPSLARSRTRHRGQRCNDCGDPDPRLPPGHGELKAE